MSANSPTTERADSRRPHRRPSKHPARRVARLSLQRVRRPRLPSRAGLTAALPTLVVLVALAVAAVELLHFTDKIWFWADDWDLFFRRGIIPGEDVGLFAPHNAHWFTMHVLVYRAVFEVFGMRSFVPYATVEIAMHLLVAWTSYLVLRRLGARAWAAVGTSLLIAFFGAGANAMIFPATMNHVGSLLFGLLATYALVRVEPGLRAGLLAAGCLLVAVMFSTTGVAVLVLVGLFGIAQRGWRVGILSVAPAAVAWATWYLLHRDQITPSSSDLEPTQIPSYVWTGLVQTLDGGIGLEGAGPVLLGVLLACLFVARIEHRSLVALAGAGLLADLFQLVVVSVGRYGFGPEQLGTSHYAYVNLVLLAPAICLSFEVAIDNVRRTPAAVGALALVLFSAYVLHGWNELQKWHDDFALITSANDEILLGIRDAHEDGEQILNDVQLSPIDVDFRPSYVASEEIRDALPDRDADPRWRLEAEGQFYVGVADKDFRLARPGGVRVFSGLEGVDDQDDTSSSGCHEFTATAAEPIIEIDSDLGNEIVVWSNSTLVKTRLQRGDEDSSLREWPVEAGAVHVATSAYKSKLFVAFNGTGSYTVCTA